jgi:hypothetical protein
MLTSLSFYIFQNATLIEVSHIFRTSLYILFRKSGLSVTPNKEVRLSAIALMMKSGNREL